MGRPRKNNLNFNLYLSPESKLILQQLKTGSVDQEIAIEDTGIFKSSFLFSAQAARLLELLQRDSKDRGHKKSKGWFVDQALKDYVAKKDEIFFNELKESQQKKGHKKSKGWFVEEALKMKYKDFYDLAKSAPIHP